MFSLETIYEHGLSALQEQGGARSEARIGRYYNYLFKDAGTVDGGTDWVRLGFHAIGAGFTYFLALMRQHFLRWPLHPMGFVFGTGFWLAGVGVGVVRLAVQVAGGALRRGTDLSSGHAVFLGDDLRRGRHAAVVGRGCAGGRVRWGVDTDRDG